jgi:hypothetical protein
MGYTCCVLKRNLPMIEITRFALLPDRTLGKAVYGEHVFWTIEKPWKDNQPFISCIPEGYYRLGRRNSPRFGPNVWEVLEVPNRTHILLHVANTADDVVGCIGFGSSVWADLGGVGSSRKAMNQLELASQEYEHEELIIKQTFVS